MESVVGLHHEPLVGLVLRESGRLLGDELGLAADPRGGPRVPARLP